MPEGSGPSGASSPPRILLVDDEPDFASALVERLSRRGFVTAVAHDAEQALAAADRSPPDAVVLDIRMPGEDGIALLRRLKARHPTTEVILLTGHATATSGIDGMRLGAFDYLTKPAEIEELAEKLRAACARKRMSEEEAAADD